MKCGFGLPSTLADFLGNESTKSVSVQTAEVCTFGFSQSFFFLRPIWDDSVLSSSLCSVSPLNSPENCISVLQIYVKFCFLHLFCRLFFFFFFLNLEKGKVDLYVINIQINSLPPLEWHLIKNYSAVLVSRLWSIAPSTGADWLWIGFQFHSI